jgi:iron complex transport system substrate-binding protein
VILQFPIPPPSRGREIRASLRGKKSGSAFIGGCIVFLCCTAAAAQQVSVTDDAGKTVTLDRPAQRIVAIAPSLAELAFAAGAGARLVGVVRYSDFPPAARGIPQVGDAVQVDLERIVALDPDLILAWKSGNQAVDLERLERLGYPVLVTEPRRLSDIGRVLRMIGTLAGTRSEAERAAGEFERGIQGLRGRYAKAPTVRVFYQIWHRPLLTVNGAHMISDVITLCGGENVFADVSQLTPAVSLEALIAAKPEVLLGGGSAGGEKEFAEYWRASALSPLRDLPAHYVNPDVIQRQTPRILEGTRAVCAALEQVRMNRQDAKAAKKNKNN